MPAKPYVTKPCMDCGKVTPTSDYLQSIDGLRLCSACKKADVFLVRLEDAAGKVVHQYPHQRYRVGMSYSQWCARFERVLAQQLDHAPTATLARGAGQDTWDISGTPRRARFRFGASIEENLALRNASMNPPRLVPGTHGGA